MGLTKAQSFSVDDIHRVREHSYESTKGMPIEEQIERCNEQATQLCAKWSLTTTFVSADSLRRKALDA